MSDDPFLDALGGPPKPAPRPAPQAPGRRLSSAAIAERVSSIPGARITSEGRSPEHNREVNGVPNSQHIEVPGGPPSTAVDVVAPGATLAQVRATVPGERVIYHNAGSGYHYHIEGDPNAPIEDVQQQAPAPDQNDPFLAALDGADKPGGVSAPPANQAPVAGGGDSGAPSPDIPVRAGERPSLGSRLWDALGHDTSVNWQDAGAGAVKGVGDVAITIEKGLDWLADKSGIDKYLPGKPISPDDINRFDKRVNSWADDPNSWSFLGGRVGGNVAATLPLSEVRVLQGMSQAGKLGAALRYGDLALQGAAAGGLTSRGENVGTNMALGAVAAPVLGAAVEKLGPKLAGVGGKIRSALLGDALAGDAAPIAAGAGDAAGGVHAPAPAEPVLPPLREGQTIRTGAQMPQPGVDVSGVAPGDDLYTVVGGTEAGALPKPVASKAAPAQIPPAALGSRGARTGIEAHDQMPAAVAEVYRPLVAKGVAPDEALREADIVANGGKPTAAQVSRNPEQMRAEKEGAKGDTPEGRALADQQAANNGALHQSAQTMVAEQGGAPEPGAAVEDAANALNEASQAARARVSAKYEEAAAQSGAKLAPVQPIIDVLNTVEARAPVTSEGRAFVSGMKRQIQQLTGPVGKSLYVDELERLRQTANAAYDPTGANKEVNALVGKVKSAIDAQFDELGNASPAYKAARDAHRKWAEAYDSPQGVAALIRTDAQGNLVNSDAWRSVENMVGAKNDKPFLQVVRQLQAVGSKGSRAALAKLKATIVQDAYEHATGRAAGTAVDQAGNSVFSGSKFHARLNTIGAKKLKALFSPSEYARLASLGRAGVAINEAVPGTVNTSNTASAVLNALAKGDKIGTPHPAAKVADKLMHAALPIGGALLHGVEGGGVGMALDAARGAVGIARTASASKANSAQLAEALRNLADPAKTRAADAAAARRLADALRHKASAKRAATATAPIAAGTSEQRR